MASSVHSPPSSPSLASHQPLPGQASAFSAHAKYQEVVHFLEDVCVRLKCLHQTPSTTSPSPIQWHSASKMAERLGFTLSAHQHLEITKRLDTIAPHIESCGHLVELIRCFARSDAAGPGEFAAAGASASALPVLDHNGWARATGTRKSAAANVVLKPASSANSPTNTVNGRPMHVYFQRFRDLHAIALPLKTGDRCGQYRIEARCRGGGPSGQAGALRLAVAKALAKAEPALRKRLSEAALLVRDGRRVERKKPGQEKARRKFSWVKR